MGRRPKSYTFHSRKARFKVYYSLLCAIITPVISSGGGQRASTSANRKANSLLVPELYPLSKLGKRRSRKDDSDGDDDENAASILLDSEDSSSDESDSDSDSDYEDEEESTNKDPLGLTSRSNNSRSASGGEAVLQDEVLRTDEDEGKHADLYGYYVYLEYKTAPARSSRAWGAALFEGFDEEELLESSTPLPTSAFYDEQDNYIVDLLLEPAAAVHGLPTLDEHATLRLVSERYNVRADQDKVIEDIRLYCRGRAAVQPTFDRIKRHWRQAKAIPITPRVLLVTDAVFPRLIKAHPFFPHKTLDGWAERCVGSGKAINRLVYKPLVVTSKLGHHGKSAWARSLGRHIHITGALDTEVIHAGIVKGADVLILDNIKWHVLFNTDMGRALCEGQEKVTWIRRGGERVTTYLNIPVIILNNKKCKTWGQNSKKYWKTHMLWVRVRKIMFDESRFINTDAASRVALPSCTATSSSSSSSSSPSTAAPTSAPSPSPSPSPSPALSPFPDSSSALCSSPVPFGLPSPPSSPRERRLVRPGLAVPDELRADISGAVGDLRQAWPTAVPIEHNGVRLGWYLPGFLSASDADAMLAAVCIDLKPHWLPRKDLTVAMRMMGKVRGVTRDKAVFSAVIPSQPNLRPIYRYDSPEYSQAVPFRDAPAVMHIRDLIAQRLNIHPNHLVANWYKAQTGAKGEKPDRIGAHSDSDRDFVPGGPIVTVTLCEPGGARDVKLTRVEHTGKVAGTVSRKTGKAQKVKSVVATAPSFTAEHGSLYILNYDANHPTEEGGVWKHEILARRGACAGRYGLTYRFIGSFWDVTTGELVNVKGKTEQAVPLNIVDSNGQRVQYDGLRWGATDTPVVEQDDVATNEETGVDADAGAGTLTTTGGKRKAATPQRSQRVKRRA